MTEEAYLSKDLSFEQNLIYFKENLTKYSQEIDPSNKTYQNDKLAFSAQRSILSNLLVLLPAVVNKVREKPTQSTVNALTNLINQINQLFEQLRNTESLEEQVDYISETIISPLLKDILTALFDRAYYTKQTLKQQAITLEDKAFLDKSFASIDTILKEIAPIIDKKQEETYDKLKSYLMEV